MSESRPVRPAPDRCPDCHASLVTWPPPYLVDVTGPIVSTALARLEGDRVVAWVCPACRARWEPEAA